MLTAYGRALARGVVLVSLFVLALVVGCESHGTPRLDAVLGGQAQALESVTSTSKAGARSFGARFTWSMDPRFELVEAAYREGRVSDYARPTAYDVSFDACGSEAGSHATYEWRLSGVGNDFRNVV